jgi:hypothetical protein
MNELTVDENIRLYRVIKKAGNEVYRTPWDHILFSKAGSFARKAGGFQRGVNPCSLFEIATREMIVNTKNIVTMRRIDNQEDLIFQGFHHSSRRGAVFLRIRGVGT